MVKLCRLPPDVVNFVAVRRADEAFSVQMSNSRNNCIAPDRTCSVGALWLESAAMTADLTLIRSSFTAVQPQGTQVAAYFYDHLFAHNPGVRPLFAPHIDEQRDRLWAALGALVANLENTETLIGM